MNNMKNKVTKIIKMLLGAVLGALTGYIGVELIMGLIGGDSPEPSAGKEEIDIGLMMLSIALALVSLVVAVVLHIILHEAGHLICGLLTGFRFVSFRIFKFTLVKEDGRLRWKRYHIVGTGGQCIMELPADQTPVRMPWFWYNAGGVVMNLLVMAISVLLLRAFDTGIVMLSFLLMMAFVGLAIALINGIPMPIGGINNDGRNLVQLWQHPEQRRYFLHSLQIVGQMSRGVRMKDMPVNWTENLPLQNPGNVLELMNRTAYMARLEDEGQIEAALAVGEEMLSFGKNLPSIFQMEVGGEVVMLLLMTGGDRNRVDELWTKQLERYVKAGSKYAPMKCAVLYTYEQLYRNDAEAANAYKTQLEQHQNDYTMPGEAKTALYLVTLISSRG